MLGEVGMRNVNMTLCLQVIQDAPRIGSEAQDESNGVLCRNVLVKGNLDSIATQGIADLIGRKVFIPNSKFEFSGWIFDCAAHVPLREVRVQLFGDGVKLESAAVGFSRPDVSSAFPGLLDDEVGFKAVLDLGALSSGDYWMEVVGESRGAAATLPIGFRLVLSSGQQQNGVNGCFLLLMAQEKNSESMSLALAELGSEQEQPNRQKRIGAGRRRPGLPAAPSVLASESCGRTP
jgi:hypothetical protein